ncbi:4766_t:CDS:1 [Acaulospora colombiana]|uniref:4766_t:CDS:1 n=1 Tax=Acaulospora colombiana TaxID=27376 RepID=A0ACA9LEF8_9GLOM|nr:4766_t:CDS:1 [Acaulospora colombiana]
MPFPPIVDDDEFMKWKRPPNAYIIYHNIFVKQLRKQRGRLKNKIVASLAGQAWKKEKEHVKDHYGRIAQELKKKRGGRILESCFQQYIPPQNSNNAGDSDAIPSTSITSLTSDSYDELFESFIDYK